MSQHQQEDMGLKEQAQVQVCITATPAEAATARPPTQEEKSTVDTSLKSAWAPLVEVVLLLTVVEWSI